MDRRRLLTILALAPALCLVRNDAGEAAEGPTLLKASDGGPPPQPPLRYGDASPGPILRLQRDAPARLLLRNGLGMPTSLDLHGIRVPPPLAATGPLGGAVAAGAEAEIAFTPPDAGTFWFHPWLLDPTRDATGEGLAGVVVVEEPAPPEADADWVAVLSDAWPVRSGPAMDTLRIDGRAVPRSETVRPGSRLRLRLVNASTRQALAGTVTGALPSVVAIDGQPSELFRPRGGTVPLAPGGRVDLMMDVPVVAGGEVGLVVRGSDPTLASALVIRTEGEPRAARGPIAPLPPNPLLPRAIALEDALRASLVVDVKAAASARGAPLWTVNGVANVDLPKKPLFVVRRGRAVTLALKNASRDLVAFRLHGFCMRQLHDLDDGWEPYWRDAVPVPPGMTHHAAFLADRPGRWLIESPFFDQAAGGLRTWFEIT